jgi:serine phosphatase RsbU (regulator of sigma subunit)
MGTLRILIVEDSPTDADLLIRALRDDLTIPFDSLLVESLDEALSEIDDEISLIITDLNLPDCSGLQTFQRLRECSGDIPIVILSGLEDVELATALVRIGAQDYVVKGAATAESLGRVVRFAIERGRRIQAERERDQATRDLQIARDIQQSLYPSKGIDLPEFEIAGAVFSAEQACGDYYDFFAIPGGRYGITIGDVCGHGLPAALTMLQLRACLRLLAKQGISPGEVIDGVHKAILHEDADRRRFASLFYATLDPATGVVNFASAGHAGWVLRTDGTSEQLEPTAMILGLTDDIGRGVDGSTQLKPGDVLVLVTDGFQETTDHRRTLFGDQRLLAALREAKNASAADRIQSLCAAVQKFAAGAPQQDDMTAAIVSMK